MAAEQDGYKKDREKAGELYMLGCEMEKQGNYYEAAKYYKQSLTLYKDNIVKAAYLKAMAAIGPM